MAITDNEYQYLIGRLANLGNKIDQTIDAYNTSMDGITGKLDRATFEQSNLIYESRFEAIERLIADVEQFATPTFLLDRTNHTGDEIVAGNVQLAGATKKVGFYGDEGAEYEAVNELGVGETTLEDVYNKLNELISVLKDKNLI